MSDNRWFDDAAVKALAALIKHPRCGCGDPKCRDDQRDAHELLTALSPHVQAVVEKAVDEVWQRVEQGTAHIIWCNGDHRRPWWDLQGSICNCPVHQHHKKAVQQARAEALEQIKEIASGVVDHHGYMTRDAEYIVDQIDRLLAAQKEARHG